MRVLLDENMPRALKRLFEAGVDVLTVGERGWKGKENGELLRAAQVEFDALVTTDQGIPHQQNLDALGIDVIILMAASNRVEGLKRLMPAVNDAIRTPRKGRVVRVSA